MNTSSDTPVNQPQKDVLQPLPCGAGAFRVSEKIDSNVGTLLNAEVRPNSRQAAVAMLFALVVARQIAARMESGTTKERVLQDLEPSIAKIIEHTCSEIRDLPSAQDEGVSPVAALSLVFQRFTEAAREDFLQMAGQVLQSGTAVQKVRDETSRETVDGRRSTGPSASPLASVISYSSSLHECWFW
jgi:hypothetical protein